jgi:hypothetical protein
MSAQEMVVAAVIAGVFMAIVSELGYRLGLVRSNLILIDGGFAKSFIYLQDNIAIKYLLGTGIHLFTSAMFGVVYYGITEGFDLHATSMNVISPYVFVLYLAMLFVALPTAGQGVLGHRIGRFAWVEQLAFHAVFAVSMWWALETI